MSRRLDPKEFIARRVRQTHGVTPDVLLEATPPDACELCGKVAELRPYGPNGEHICFDCGTKDREAMDRAMGHALFGGDK